MRSPGTRGCELAVLTLMNRLNCNYGFVRHLEIAERAGLSRAQIDNIGSYQQYLRQLRRAEVRLDGMNAA